HPTKAYQVFGGTFSGPGEVQGDLEILQTSEINLGAGVGTLHITGNLTQSIDATLVIKFAGINQIDIIKVDGKADVTKNPPYTLLQGDILTQRKTGNRIKGGVGKRLLPLE